MNRPNPSGGFYIMGVALIAIVAASTSWQAALLTLGSALIVAAAVTKATG